jgi:long-chain acyl-CoA synthetase
MEKRVWHSFYDKHVPASIPYPEKTLYDLFQDAVKANPDGTATLFFGASIKYRQLGKLVDRFADALADLGVKKGDRVALIMPNFPAYPIAHFAVCRLGGILVPTNPLYVERELAKQLSDSGAETVVVMDKLYPRLAQVRNQTGVKRIIVTQVKDFLPGLIGFLYGLKDRSGIRTDQANQVYLYRDLMRMPHPKSEPAKVGPADIAILLYTGGTTGVSKGAMLTHRNAVVNVLQTKTWLYITETGKDVLLCVLPFFHSYGMTTGLHLSVSCASTMLLVPRFELAEVMKRIKKHKPTIFCAVPSMYNAINHYPEVSPRDVGSIQLCVSGGSALPQEVQNRFEALTGGKLVEGYGLSETSPVTHVNPVLGYRKSGTIGLPMPDTDAKIVDPDTRKPLQPGETGELAIKGPQVMREYWNMPEETAGVLKDGWLYTGDIAVMDSEGFFRIVDRKKDLIISAGMNVYPREVEEVLHQHPKVVEAAVVGIPSRVRDEVVKAYIVVKKGETLSKGEIVQFCRDKLSKFKVPKEIEFVEELPKSAVGKVLKRVIRETEKKKKEG